MEPVLYVAVGVGLAGFVMWVVRVEIALRAMMIQPGIVEAVARTEAQEPAVARVPDYEQNEAFQERLRASTRDRQWKLGERLARGFSGGVEKREKKDEEVEVKKT